MSEVKTYQLTNKNGLSIEFIAQGGKLTKVLIPNGKSYVDIALGYDTAQQFVDGDLYIGALCGRFANRIENGKFALNGQTFQLEQNDNPNHLHGGFKGFNVKEWNVEPIEKEGCTKAFKLSLVSPDGDSNYPGELKVTTIYGITEKNELLIEFEAVTNKTTIVNLTSHPYFNLNGTGNGTVLNHTLQVNANEFTPLGNGVPSGEIRKVAGTPFDLNQPKEIGDQVKSDYEQIARMKGYDHNWVVNKPSGIMGLAAKVAEPVSGRFIEVYSTQPGIQIYTAMHFDGKEKGKDNVPFIPYCGIAMEAQGFPDAPNKSNFPSCVLNPGEVYKQTIIYKFGW